MKRAIISDVHGNLEALQAVLADIDRRRVDEIFSLGDLIGYGPNPVECIDLVMQRAKVCLLGNHDQATLFDPEGFNAAAEQAIFWTRQQLENCSDVTSVKRWDFLGELPRIYRDGDTLYVHGSPRNPLNEYVFQDDIFDERKMERIFSVVPQYSFQGHTHVPGIFTDRREFFAPSEIENRYVLTGTMKVMVNVGSVGQSRDRDPKACYVILEDNVVHFHRVEYPLETTVAKVLAISDLDNNLGIRLRTGR